MGRVVFSTTQGPHVPWYLDIALRVIIVVFVIIALTRLHGLRTFSKMSGFDFAITVAIGSVLAGAITTLKTDLHIYVGALVGLIALQIVMAQLRAHSDTVGALLDNRPLLIMQDGIPIDDNLRKAGMTHADLWAKLREANAFDLKTVHAVIVEATGDVSVLHGSVDGPKPDDVLLQQVRR